MKRIVVLGQGGAFGRSACAYVADRLGQRLGLERLAARHAASGSASSGWIAVETAGPFSLGLFLAADTAVWLHYSVWAVAREWTHRLPEKLAGTRLPEYSPPRLADLAATLQHMAWTPHVLRWLQHPSLAHLHVHHLRSPAETHFWLHAQEHLLPLLAAEAQPA
jgi:hypothetical protein